MRVHPFSFLAWALIGLMGARAKSATEWVRGELGGARWAWGARGGLLFGIHPGSGPGASGPRGLIRLAYPTLEGGGCDLINFIAIEPVVKGRRGLSELEPSRFDGAAGKRIRAIGENQGITSPTAGRITQLPGGAAQLEVIFEVEPFENGAHVRITARQRSDRPDEVEFTINAEPDSAPMDACVLSATMGNKARARRLWLAGGPESCSTLYPGFSGTSFASHTVFGAERLLRTSSGDLLAAITTDEENPAAVFPFPGTRLWYYGGAKVTQYWRKPVRDLRVDGGLQAAVNARATYWQTRREIPGGPAFENFELRERFHDGQVFVFGITKKTPEKLGFSD